LASIGVRGPPNRKRRQLEIGLNPSASRRVRSVLGSSPWHRPWPVSLLDAKLLHRQRSTERRTRSTPRQVRPSPGDSRRPNIL
jgi:hypothetical protein